MDEKIGALTTDQSHRFFDLHNIYGSKHSLALGIARTNAFPLGFSAMGGGIFLEASRINHSCRHNSQNTWNSGLSEMTTHAFKDIEKGEEITISYLSASENYATRQSRLLAAFGFVCTCELCLLPPAQRQQSDKRLYRITYIDGQIGNGLRITSTPLACLHDAHELLRFLGEEDVADSRIPRLYYDAFQIAIANGNQARVRAFAQRASVQGSSSRVRIAQLHSS